MLVSGIIIVAHVKLFSTTIKKLRQNLLPKKIPPTPLLSPSGRKNPSFMIYIDILIKQCRLLIILHKYKMSNFSKLWLSSLKRYMQYKNTLMTFVTKHTSMPSKRFWTAILQALLAQIECAQAIWNKMRKAKWVG